MLSQVLSRPIAFSERTVEEEKQAMMSAGVPQPIAAMNANALGLIADGDSAWINDDVSMLLGHPARSLEQFAIEYASAFS